MYIAKILHYPSLHWANMREKGLNTLILCLTMVMLISMCACEKEQETDMEAGEEL